MNAKLLNVIKQVTKEKQVKQHMLQSWENYAQKTLNSIYDNLTSEKWEVEKEYDTSRPSLNIKIGDYTAIVGIFWQQHHLSYLSPNSGAINNRGWKLINEDEIENVLLNDAMTIERMYSISNGRS